MFGRQFKCHETLLVLKVCGTDVLGTVCLWPVIRLCATWVVFSGPLSVLTLSYIRRLVIRAIETCVNIGCDDDINI